MAEMMSWLVIAGVVVCYMQKQTRVPSEAAPLGPSAEFEVDPTRWRHDGKQPIHHKEGNQAPHVDEQVRRVLAF